jgi:hypothetical protein
MYTTQPVDSFNIDNINHPANPLIQPIDTFTETSDQTFPPHDPIPDNMRVDI